MDRPGAANPCQPILTESKPGRSVSMTPYRRAVLRTSTSPEARMVKLIRPYHR